MASWSADGQTIAFNRGTPETGLDIGLLSIASGEVKMLLAEQQDGAFPAISPDGRWVAYTTVSGLYVQPFPNVADGRWQLSENGLFPMWASDSSAVFFARLEAGVFSMAKVPVSLEPTFSHGQPETLFDVGPYFELDGRGERGRPTSQFDLSPDGRFLMTSRRDVSRDPLDLVVELDWFTELERLVPTN